VEIPADGIFGEVVQAWGLPAEWASPMARAFYQYFRANRSIMPDAEEALTSLRGRGFALAVFTDLPTGMPPDLAHEDATVLLPHLDLILTSGDVGYRKPNPTGLLRVARHFGMPSGRIAYVGDEEKDMQAARHAGMAGIRVDRVGRAPAGAETHRVSTLSDLARLL
jgi:HAD superfamily hydrolase (TIGR01549 family)